MLQDCYMRADNSPITDLMLPAIYELKDAADIESGMKYQKRH